MVLPLKVLFYSAQVYQSPRTCNCSEWGQSFRVYWFILTYRINMLPLQHNLYLCSHKGFFTLQFISLFFGAPHNIMAKYFGIIFRHLVFNILALLFQRSDPVQIYFICKALKTIFTLPS